MFALVNAVVAIILTLVDRVFGWTVGEQGIISAMYSLAVFVPGLAVVVRRLHDTGRSGWNYLWVFTCIGAFYVLYLMIIEGDHGPNKYGADPKSDEDDDPFAGQREEVNPYSDPTNPFHNDSN